MSMCAITLSGSFTAASPRAPPADIAEPAQVLAAFIAGVDSAGAAADPAAADDPFVVDGYPLLVADAGGVVIAAAGSGAAAADS